MFQTVIKYSYWSAGSQTLGCTKLLICQFVVICGMWMWDSIIVTWVPWQITWLDAHGQL